MRNILRRIIPYQFKRIYHYYFKNNIFYHKYPVFVNSIPKCGTNLLLNIFKAIPNTMYIKDLSYAMDVNDGEGRLKYLQKKISTFLPGSFYTGHVPHTIEIAAWFKQKKFKHIWIYRDPRDYAVSHYNFFLNDATTAYHKEWLNMKNNSERLMASIIGTGKGKMEYYFGEYDCKKDLFRFECIANVCIIYSHFERWLSDENVLPIRYENLIDKEKSLTEIIRILNFLGFKNENEKVTAQKIMESGFDPSKSHTFRLGRSGAWKEEFTQAHLDAFNSIGGAEVLKKFNY